MSHDEKTSRAFSALMTGAAVADLCAAVEYLARQVADLRGLDYQASGDAIIREAKETGKDINWKRMHAALGDIQPPPTCHNGEDHIWEIVYQSGDQIGATIQYGCSRCHAATALVPAGTPPPGA